ncbi:MAG: hypothetical protein WCJ81_07230 [bacterium]
MNTIAPEQNRIARAPEVQVRPSGVSAVDAAVKNELTESLNAANGGSEVSDDILAAMKKDPLFANWRNEEAMDPRKLKQKKESGDDESWFSKAKWRPTESADSKSTAEKIDELKGKLDEDESDENNDKKGEKTNTENSKKKDESKDEKADKSKK